MAAGTVISGGFPGRVAQEVQPNPKCNGCLHFDGQAGRTGACTIGSKPWLCGEGDAADIGYAPIARGAGTYLHGMAAPVSRAHEVGDQDTASMYGAGSTRPVTFQQVSLGEEHVHFAKSFIAKHDTLQKSLCRLCKSTNMIGSAPANVAPQVCTCESLDARTVAKALVPRLSNLEASVVSLNDLVAFVYACAKSNFNPNVAKATFYHEHGKYETSPAGNGTDDHHVDFHPRGGGKVTRVATVSGRGAARATARTHATRFASGTGADNAGGHKPKSTHTPAGMPSMKDAISVVGKSEDGEDADVEKGLSWKVLGTGQPRAEASHGTYRIQTSGDKHVASYAAGGGEGFKKLGSGSTHAEAKQVAAAHHAKTGGGRLRRSEETDDGDIEKSIDNEKHAHIVTGKLAPGGRGATTRSSARGMVDKLDAKYGAASHSVSRNPNFKPKTLKWEKHGGYGEGAHVAEAGHGRYIRQPDSGGGHNVTYAPHGHGEDAHMHGGHHMTPEAAHDAAQQHHKTTQHFDSNEGTSWGPRTKKSLDNLLQELHDADDIEKSLRWSHKVQGQAKTSHGSYQVAAHPKGGHTVTYTHKATGRTEVGHYKSHREALGALTEHHLKNRPPPKKRKPKAAKAPEQKQLTARAGAAPHCPPCP